MWLLATCMLFLFLFLPHNSQGRRCWCPFGFLSEKPLCCKRPGPGVFRCPALCEKVKQATNLILLLFSTRRSFSKKGRGGRHVDGWREGPRTLRDEPAAPPAGHGCCWLTGRELFIYIYIYINKIFSLLVLIGTTSYDVFFPLKKVL